MPDFARVWRQATPAFALRDVRDEADEHTPEQVFEEGDVEVRLKDQPIPLLFAGPGQVNAQIPYTLLGDVEYQLEVRRGSSLTTPQPLVIDNRASGIIPGEVAARTSPDGYSLLFYNNTLWVAPLIQKTSYDAVKDFVAVTLVSRSPNILVVHSALPVTSVQQLIALAKKRPGELNYATGSTGASNHIAAELFKAMSGANIVRIPFKNGSLESAALMSGEVQIMFGSVSMMPYVRSGRLRALAVTSAKPSALLPGLPTVASSGLPGFEAEVMTGLLAPARTPPAVIQKLNIEIRKAAQSAEVIRSLGTQATSPTSNTPEEFAAFIKSEQSRFAVIVKESGARAD